jgi:hypothetical protein
MTVDVKKLTVTLTQLNQMIDQAMPAIYDKFVQTTPIDTGNARASTTRNNRTINANYQYATVLDKGRSFRDGRMRGSKQAPQGMSQPTIDFAKQEIIKRIKQLGI